MNIETLMTILVVAIVATLLVRVFTGFTLAGILVTFLLGCLGAVGGWVAQQRLALPTLYAFPFPGDHVAVSAVWPGLAALLAALIAGLLWRPRPRPRRRTR